MIKKFALLGLILIASSCAKEDQNHYEINGTIASTSNKRLVKLFEVDANRAKITKDSTLVNDGKFYFKGNVDHADTYYISVEGVSGILPVILENTDINIAFYKDSLSKSQIKGSKENDVFSKYIEESSIFRRVSGDLRDSYAEAQRENKEAKLEAIKKSFDSLMGAIANFDKNFVKTNGDKVFAAVTLKRMVGTNAISREDAKSHYDLLSESVKLTKSAKFVKELLDKSAVVPEPKAESTDE